MHCDSARDRLYVPGGVQVPQYRSQVIVRACVIGEVAATPATCTLCPAATFSLSPANSSCDTPCPNNAECLGGAILIPEQGYWHSAADSTYMASCPNPSACSGARHDLVACQNASYAASSTSGQTQVYLLALPRGCLSCPHLLCFALIFCQSPAGTRPCPALSRPAPPRPAPPRPAAFCPALPRPALPFPALPCPSATPLPCPALPSPPPPCPALPFPALPCPLVFPFLQLLYPAFLSISLSVICIASA